MYSQYSNKPLHLPAPKHRDRRGGAATSTLRSALARPADRRMQGSVRSDAERHRSRARLLARRPTGDIGSRVAALVLLVFGLVVLGVAVALLSG